MAKQASICIRVPTMMLLLHVMMMTTKTAPEQALSICVCAAAPGKGATAQHQHCVAGLLQLARFAQQQLAAPQVPQLPAGQASCRWIWPWQPSRCLGPARPGPQPAIAAGIMLMLQHPAMPHSSRVRLRASVCLYLRWHDRGGQPSAVRGAVLAATVQAPMPTAGHGQHIHRLPTSVGW